jgi:hypothetical protein
LAVIRAQIANHVEFPNLAIHLFGGCEDAF